jgi:hypothetical protein
MKKFLTILIAITMLMSFAGCQNIKTIDNTMPKTYTEIGEGGKEFLFSVIDKEGEKESFLVHTDKEIVGDALLEQNIIEGEDGPYGMYVKKVNGISADFDKDKVYWAFYIDGEYATSGVDKTKIEEGKQYAFRVEK